MVQFSEYVNFGTINVQHHHRNIFVWVGWRYCSALLLTLVAVSMSQYFGDMMSSTDLNSMALSWSDDLKFFTVDWYYCISGPVAYVAAMTQDIGDEGGWRVGEHRWRFNKYSALLDDQCFGRTIHIASHDIFNSALGYPGEGPIVVDNGMDSGSDEEIEIQINVDGNIVDRRVCKKCGQRHAWPKRATQCTCRRFCNEL